MKNFFALSTLLLSFAAMAQAPIALDAASIDIQGSSAIVARTSATPEKVKLNLLIPKARTVCVEHDTRYVFRASEFHCGYDLAHRTETIRHCDAIDKETQKCAKYIYEHRTVTVRIPRSCMVPETVCVRTGTQVTHEKESMTLTFKKLHALGGSEADVLRVSGQQKSFGSSGVIFEAQALETIRPVTVRRAKRLFGSSDDDFVVEAAR
jgi:hypothetical protein